MRIICILFLLVVSSLYSSCTKGEAREYRPTVLLSVDGFAHHYLQEYQPKHIISLTKSGVVANALIPVFPTKTFPNHLSIVTGNYPQNHGLVHNSFFNRQLNQRYKLGIGKFNNKWVTSSTLWTIAEKNNIKTAIYFWPESELSLNEYSPSYNLPYVHNTPNKARFDQIIEWLKLSERNRPELILGYFSTIDSAGHNFGIHSDELSKAISTFDDLLGVFLQRVKRELPFDINLVLVSDHGMTDISEQRISYFHLFDGVDTVQVVNGQTQLYVYLEDPMMENEVSIMINENIRAREKDYIKVHKFEEFPQSWHFNSRSPVMPNIIIEAVPPFTFGTPKEKGRATHGYDPKLSNELSAIFIANGPSFKNNVSIESFENIHILPMILSLYDIETPKNIDGNKNVLYPILK